MRFLKRLIYLNKEAKLVIFELMYHGFCSFAYYNLFVNMDIVINKLYKGFGLEEAKTCVEIIIN